MERPTKAINGRISQQSMSDNVIEPSLPYISIQHKTTIQDLSFSSYLNPEAPNNQLDDAELSIFNAQRYFDETSTDSKQRVSPVDFKVIGIDCILERSDFSSVPRVSSASSSVDRRSYSRNYRTRSFHDTPTASSEASWNSQTGLLTNPPGAISVSIRNPPATNEKRRGLSSKCFFCRNCLCYGRKSVQVEEKLSEPRTPTRINNRTKVSVNVEKQIPDTAQNGQEKIRGATHHWLEKRESLTNSLRISADNTHFPPHPGTVHHHRVLASARQFGDGSNGFTFPVLPKPSSPKSVVLSELVLPTRHSPPLQDPPRDSLEVFQPAEDSLSTKLNPAEPHPSLQGFTFPASPKSRMAIVEDDLTSDASSDLFEIESLSTQTTSYPIYNHCRDSLDEASTFTSRTSATTTAYNGGGFYAHQSVDEPVTPSVAAIEWYEPSEASIAWSVVTAEGFDRVSNIASYSVAASEADYMANLHHREGEKMDGGGGEERRRGGNGGLLSCRSAKAVNVGPQPVRICVPEEGQRGVSSTLKHHVSSSSSKPPVVANSYKPSLGRSHSARLSLPFAA